MQGSYTDNTRLCEFTTLKIAPNNFVPPDATELIRLMNCLKLEDPHLFPYSETLAALNKRYGKPHKLALMTVDVMDSPDIRWGDTKAFDISTLRIRSLIRMLNTFSTECETKLKLSVSHLEIR